MVFITETVRSRPPMRRWMGTRTRSVRLIVPRQLLPGAPPLQMSVSFVLPCFTRTLELAIATTTGDGAALAPAGGPSRGGVGVGANVGAGGTGPGGVTGAGIVKVESDVLALPLALVATRR
jgi:hypothetical protein